jgi:hypothetical protein
MPTLVSGPALFPGQSPSAPHDTGTERQSAPVKKTTLTAAGPSPRPAEEAGSRRDLLREAHLICQAAAAKGERISQRALARELRGHGHRFSNEHLHGIAANVGLGTEQAA